MQSIRKFFKSVFDSPDPLERVEREAFEELFAGQVESSELAELYKFVCDKRNLAERMESYALDGNHRREKARNAGKASAFDLVATKMVKLGLVNQDSVLERVS